MYIKWDINSVKIDLSVNFGSQRVMEASCCLVAFLSALLIQTAAAAPAPSNSSTTDTCSNGFLLKEIARIVDNSSPGIKHLGDIPAYAATSCAQVAEFRSGNLSGYYWIQEGSGPARVFCQMDGEEFGEEGVWMRVAGVNMTETNSQCPSGLELVTSPKRLCRKRVSSGCSSAKFSVHGIPYKKVCGKVIGYQYYSPDAFRPFYHDQQRTIDGLYVEGVSITHGSSPRHHIWTLAAALDEVPDHNKYSCPCTNSKSHVPYTGLIPPFVGTDYYCETGSRTSYRNKYYLQDPLWDGQGCGRFSSCCEGSRKPWFCKELPAYVTDDIELRVCCSGSRSGEDVLLETIELYIQ